MTMRVVYIKTYHIRETDRSWQIVIIRFPFYRCTEGPETSLKSWRPLLKSLACAHWHGKIIDYCKFPLEAIFLVADPLPCTDHFASQAIAIMIG